MATDFEKSVSSFQAKIDAKREALDLKAFEIKNYLSSEANIYAKKAKLASASTTLENRYLNNPASKDFETIFNRIESDTLDGDTIEITPAYENFYGRGFGKEPKKETIRLGSNDPGQSLDTYETAKYETDALGEYVLDAAGNKKLLPYNENKYDYHRIHYAKVNGLPNKDYVTQEMLNKEAKVQTNRLVQAIYKGETWDDYGVTPNRGEAVPYPKEYQDQIDTLSQEFYKEANVLAGEQKITELSRERRTEETANLIKKVNEDELDKLPKSFILGIDSQINDIYTWFENRQDKSSLQKLKAIERKINKVKFMANDLRPPIDASILTGDVNIDIRKDGVGIYNRTLGTVTNPLTGEVLNDSLNNITNNAAYFSKYNKAYVDEILANVNEIARQPNPDGEGFLAEIYNGLMGGYDNIQAVVYGTGMLIADWRGDVEKANEWMQKAHRELESAKSRGVQLPTVEELDWRNPRAVLSKVGKTFGEGIPSIATMYGTGSIFGWLGKKGATKFVSKKISQAARNKSIATITTVSQYSGAFTAANVMETGGIYLDVAEAGERDRRAQIMSIIGGSTAASLEAIFPASLFATKGASKAAIDGIKKKFIKRLIPALATISKSTASGASIESVTEGLQFVVSEITQELIKEGNLEQIERKEFVSGIINSMFAGAIPGGGIRLTTSSIAGARDLLIDSDKSQTRRLQREVEQEARTASEETILSKNETRTLDEIVIDSDTELSTVVKQILKDNKALKLNKGKDPTQISVALKILDELNLAKNNATTKKETEKINLAITKLETAINSFESGSPKQQVAIQKALIQSKYNREIAVLKKEYAIKESEAVTDKELKALNKEQKEKTEKLLKTRDFNLKKAERSAEINKANRAERTVINKKVEDALTTINKINKKLESSKISKSERKRLERQRQAQARLINSFSLKFELMPDTKAKVEKALNSYDWFNDRIVSRTSNQTIEKVKARSDDVQEDLLEANSATIIDEERINTLLQKLQTSYEEITVIKDELLKAALDTTNSREKKELGALIRGLEQYRQRIDNATRLVQEREESVDSKEKQETVKKQTKASDILNSLKINVINKELKLPKSVIKNLTNAEQNLYSLRTKIANLHVQLTPSQSFAKSEGVNYTMIRQVHKQVLEGDIKQGGRFTGLKDYLSKAENGKPFLSAFASFKEHHNKKLKAFEEAENIVFNAGKDANVIVYVDKTTFKILQNDNGNSWWVNYQTGGLTAHIKKEVEYINILSEYIDAVIDNRSVKNEVKKAKARNKKIIENIQSQTVLEDTVIDSDLNSPEFVDAVEEESTVNDPKPKKEVVVPSTEEEGILNNVLNKFTDQFFNLALTADNLLKVKDLFTIKDINRTSFFSTNKEINLTTKFIKKQLISIGMDPARSAKQNAEYINAVTKVFTSFKNSLIDNVLPNIEEIQKKLDTNGGVYALSNPQLLLTLENGTIPDEVIFAMMLSTMHWAGINQNISRNTPRYKIASILFDDPKQTNRISSLQFETFKDSGIAIRSVVSDISTEILDTLNIKGQKAIEDELFIKLDLAKLDPSFNEVLSQDPVIAKRTGDALALLSIEAARFLAIDKTQLKTSNTIKQTKRINNKDVVSNTSGTVIKDGFFKFHHGRYPEKLFENSSNYVIEKINGINYVVLNSLVIQDSKTVNTILEIFKNNAKNFEKIKGNATTLNDIFNEPVTEIQERTRDSFFVLTEEQTDVVNALQNVMHKAKEDLYPMFNALSNKTLRLLNNFNVIEEQNDEKVEGKKAANNEIDQDINILRDYVKNDDNSGFYYRWNVMKQGRFQILSNTINQQASKMHRSFFYSNNPSTVNTDADRAVFKLAVAQALGFKVSTLNDAQEQFNDMYDQSTSVGAIVAEILKILKVLPKTNIESVVNTELNSLIEELIAEGTVKPSMHVLEGLVGLAQYNTTSFVTTLGFETDGTTSGYAIALLQFAIGSPKELLTQLARVGINAQKGEVKDTFEKFIARGELDVYEFFSDTFYTDLTKEDETGLTPEDLLGIEVLHGEFYVDTVNEKLSKFARDMAKSPVMISNYGASIQKVITNVVESILPDLQDKLAKLQTQYNKATLENEKTEIENKVKVIEIQLNKVLQFYANSRVLNNKKKRINSVSLSSRLKKKGNTKNKFNKKVYQNNLYGVIFDVNQTEAFNRYFSNIYTEPFTTTLETILGPLKEASDLIVQATETMHFAFMQVYTDAITYIDPKTGKTKKIINLPAKLAIAKELKSLLPQVRGFGTKTDEDVIDLSDTNPDDSKAIQIFTKGIAAPIEIKTDDWIEVENRNFTTLQTLTFTPNFVAPGVAAIIRQILNIDSVIIGALAKENPNGMSIHDAKVSSINDVIPDSIFLNNKFKEIGLNWNILDETLQSLDKVIKELAKRDPSNTKNYLNKVNKNIQFDSFQADILSKRLKTLKQIKLTNSVVKRIKETEEKIKKIENSTVDSIREEIIKKIAQINKDQSKIDLENSRSSQYYIPESILDLSLTPNKVVANTTGQEKNDEDNTNKEVNANEVVTTPLNLEDITKINKEIEASQGDLENANLTPNNINTVPFVWEPLTKTAINSKSRAELAELAKSINVAIEDRATKDKIIQRITDSQNGVPQEPIEPTKPKVSSTKPFINYIKKLGGIKPGSSLAIELASRDITAKSMPGVFNKNSKVGDGDNIPISELASAGLFAEDDGNGYATIDWVSERIEDEMSGIVGLTDDDQVIKNEYDRNLENYAEDKAEYDRAKLLDNNSENLGSILGSLEQETEADLNKIYTSTDLRANLLNIFNKIGEMHSQSYFSNEDRDTQQTHLKRVLNDIIGKAGPILDKTVVTLYKGKIRTTGQANITNNSVNVNINKFAPKSYSQQNGQEVYTHELIHILTRFIFKNNPEFRRNVKRIRDQVKKHIEKTEKRPYEIFLHRDDNGKIITRRDEESEIEAAKEQYDYVFVRPPADAVLDEFLAYSLTNKFLVTKLKEIRSEGIPFWSKDPSDSVVEKLFTLFAEMMKKFTNLLQGKTKSNNLQEEIFNLTKEVIEVNQSKRNTLANAIYIDKAGSIADQGNKILSDFIKQAGTKGLNITGDKYNKMVDLLTRQGKIDNFVADVLYNTKLMTLLTAKNQELIENNSEIQRTLAKIYGSFKPGSLKILSSVKTDILGNVNQDFIKLLYKSNKVVDANRRAHKEITKKQLKKLFKDYKAITDEDKRAITRVVLKTDLSVLLDKKAFTLPEIMELIKNPVTLENAIAEYKKNLTSYQLLQSEGLADYMITNKTGVNNQYLNANNIYSSNPLKGKNKDKKESITNQIDVYVTLLALQKTGQGSKDLFTTIQEREFGLNNKSNGIQGLINLHIGFKRDSLERAFKGNPVLIQKGYIAQITDSDVKLRVELSNIETQIKMKSEGYQFIGSFHNIAGLKGEDWGLYTIKNDPDLSRTKGVLSMTAMAASGTNYMSIRARNGDDAGQLKAKLGQFAIQELAAAQLQESKFKTGTSINKSYKMVPLLDEDMNIYSYRFNLRQNELENYMKQNLSFEEVMPTMFSQIEDRINSELINEEAIKLMDQYRAATYKKNPKKFINILDPAFKQEYFEPLPKQAKYEIMQRAKFNKKLAKEEFLVERGYLDTIFGYVNPSISNLIPKGRAPKSKRYLKVAEKLVKEMVNMATVNIVIKIPIVPAANFTSNFITSWLYGVPPWYLAKKWYEGVKELKDYREMANELKLLDLDMLSNPALKTSSALKLKRATLVADMNKNKVAWFIDEGLFNSITEDINQNDYTYRNKMLNKLKEKGGKLVTGRVSQIANEAYIGEHTAIFKASMHFLQISDFIARYALYNYQTEQKGMNKKEAYQLMIQTFVNYDQPLNRYLGYTNDMGLILFVKYWMRIQRAGVHLMINKPLNSAILFSGNTLLGLDIETILNSNLITGNFLPTPGGIEKILEEVFIPPGVEIMMLEGF